jgi:hypothetical protein
MAKIVGKNENSTTGAFPGAQSGGRVHLPIHETSEGFDQSVEPEDSDIYSGLRKRTAREEGRFTPRNKIFDRTGWR